MDAFMHQSPNGWRGNEKAKVSQCKQPKVATRKERHSKEKSHIDDKNDGSDGNIKSLRDLPCNSGCSFDLRFGSNAIHLCAPAFVRPFGRGSD
jgi:thiamine monophosphate kinase